MDLDKLRALIASAPKPPCAALTPFSIVEADSERGLVHVEIKTSFLAPAKLGVCVGEEQVLRAGKSLVFAEGRLWGSDGKLAVHATATLAAR